MTRQVREGRLSNLKVLVVEDEWLAADTLCVLLEEEGANIVGPCSRAAEALERVRSETLDFALVDMQLADGFADDLIEDIVARGIPYVIITAFETLPTNADARAVAMLHKPINKKALIDQMASRHIP